MKKDMDLQEALDNIGERLKLLEVAHEGTNLAIQELVRRTEVLPSHTHRLKGLENHVNSLQDLHKLAAKADDTLLDALNALEDVVRENGALSILKNPTVTSELINALSKGMTAHSRRIAVLEGEPNQKADSVFPGRPVPMPGMKEIP